MLLSEARESVSNLARLITELRASISRAVVRDYAYWAIRTGRIRAFFTPEIGRDGKEGGRGGGVGVRRRFMATRARLSRPRRAVVVRQDVAKLPDR